MVIGGLHGLPLVINNISKLILQWGIQANTQYGTFDKYFPVAFSDNKYIVLAGDWASPNNAPYAKAIAVDYNNLTTTRFVAHFLEHQPRGFAYIAIGV